MLAADQDAAVMASRNDNKLLTCEGGGGEGKGGLGGGGGGLGQAWLRAVLLVMTSPGVVLKRPGRPPHSPVLSLRNNEVSCDMPLGHDAGMVDTNALLFKLSSRKDDKDCHASGRVPDNALACKSSNVN